MPGVAETAPMVLLALGAAFRRMTDTWTSFVVVYKDQSTGYSYLDNVTDHRPVIT